MTPTLTKIVATMGPAWGDGDTFAKMVASVDVCRLNFSHGTLDAHDHSLARVRAVSTATCILGDLCGPKIRVALPSDAPVTVREGDVLIITRHPTPPGGDRPGEAHIATTHPPLIDELGVGDRVLIEDGLLRFLCVDKSPDALRCSCTVGGQIKQSKGINVPGTRLSLPSITAKDWDAVNWAIERRLDYLALSFVRRADEIIALREYLRSRASPIGIIAKVEMAEAVDNIDAILDASDGLMIARGDLGVELDPAQVPIIQKDLLAKCRRAGKPAIVATQMLQSMIVEATPTRAEVSDIANAIIDGTDAVMLSGETSVGKYPLAAIAVMRHTAEVTEAFLRRNPAGGDVPTLGGRMLIRQAVVRGVREIVRDLAAAAVAVWSDTGGTARIFAKSRFTVPILALSADEHALRRMRLLYGVTPIHHPRMDTMADLVAAVTAEVTRQSIARPPARIVIVGGALGAAGEGTIAVKELT